MLFHLCNVTSGVPIRMSHLSVRTMHMSRGLTKSSTPVKHHHTAAYTPLKVYATPTGIAHVSMRWKVDAMMYAAYSIERGSAPRVASAVGGGAGMVSVVEKYLCCLRVSTPSAVTRRIPMMHQ